MDVLTRALSAVLSTDEIEVTVKAVRKENNEVKK
jgi:hypothetical protein